MKRIYLKYILLFLSVFTVLPALKAQNKEWKLIHNGNTAFRKGMYKTAASYYSKALEIDSTNTRALYDLGNARMALGEDSAALANYEKLLNLEKGLPYRAAAHHNIGTLYQREAGADGKLEEKQQHLRMAIEAYKEALRCNPTLNETRYNLVLCQKQLLKGSGGSGDNDENQEKQKEPQKKQQEEKKKDTQPLMNYSRKAEQQTRKKINATPLQRSLRKNW